jgi:hypothetical protein
MCWFLSDPLTLTCSVNHKVSVILFIVRSHFFLLRHRRQVEHMNNSNNGRVYQMGTRRIPIDVSITMGVITGRLYSVQKPRTLQKGIKCVDFRLVSFNVTFPCATGRNVDGREVSQVFPFLFLMFPPILYRLFHIYVHFYAFIFISCSVFVVVLMVSLNGNKVLRTRSLIGCSEQVAGLGNSAGSRYTVAHLLKQRTEVQQVQLLSVRNNSL